ncbi:MAG: hypothetical protein AABZ60_24780 [Planctomycetota bacterium]
MNKINLLPDPQNSTLLTCYPLFENRQNKNLDRKHLIVFLANPKIPLEEKWQRVIESRRMGEEISIADLYPTPKIMDWIFDNYSWFRSPRKEDQANHFIVDVESVRFEFDRNKTVGEGRWISLRRKETRAGSVVNTLKDIVNTKLTETLLTRIF